jgi:sodium/hydrogen exchanger 8
MYTAVMTTGQSS